MGTRTLTMLASSRLAVVAARRSFSTGAETTIQLNAGAFNSFECNGPTMTETTVSNDDMIKWYKDMFTIRRMEIASDTMYKQREIRGFCHLYDGQEAVAVGMEAACTLEDHFVTAYRDHAHQYCRGDTVKSIMAELTGEFAGCSKGKGGSMHMYKEDANFYGGNGIVGAQIPIGAGLALAIKYKKTPDAMAVALCENNNFAMGTSTARHAAMDEFYKRGNACAVPGLRVDGMDLLAVNEATKWAKDYVTTGNGPLVMEMMTYRYHGHSMSDPGVTYRSRDDVNEVRKTRDPVELSKNRIIDAGFATKEEMKQMEKEVRAEVQEAVDFSLADEEAGYDEMFSDIYSHYDFEDRTRTVERHNYYIHDKKKVRN